MEMGRDAARVRSKQINAQETATVWSAAKREEAIVRATETNLVALVV